MQVVLEATRAGLIYEAYTDLHRRSDDELRFEVSTRSVSGNSDRFTVRFRKPDGR